MDALMGSSVRLPSSLGELPTLPAPVFAVSQLGLYYGEKPAFRDVSLEIAPQRITAILGPSGCGKTSFLSCLNRMIDLIPGCRVEGSVRFRGRDIFAPSMDVTGLRRRVGLVFQKPNPFPLSIRRNLEIPLREHGLRDPAAVRAKTEEVLQAVGLWTEVQHRLGSPALALSGGQQQRLCIARALALEPDTLLCDEPCSALDPIASATIESLLSNLRKRYTIVIVTHNLAQARRISDFAAVFWAEGSAGRLLEMGPTTELFRAPSHPITAEYLSGARG
jgi:phosphate transport system ATP-binding protein